MFETPRVSMVEPRSRRPWLAALLSFVFPGLGQAYVGLPALAALFAAPVVILASVIALVVGGFGGNLGNNLLSTRFLYGILAVNLALLLWRAAAIVHSGLAAPAGAADPHRRVTLSVLAALVTITVAMHGWVAVTVIQLEGTLNQVFGGADIGFRPTPGPSGEPVEPDDDEPAWDGEEQINVLLLGTDEAPGREAVLTDVIMVLSIDPQEGTAAMVSVPRDTGYVPLPDASIYADGLFPEKVNELAAHAARDAAVWCPDLADEPQTCGIRAAQASVGLYVGLTIDHYALVDMAGFAELIDALGGLELCLPGELVDPEFDGSLDNTNREGWLVLPAGCHHYDGIGALAYSRSRKGWIEMADGTRVSQTDFDRSERQQQVLLALRDELAEADTFLELPGILGAVGRTVSTDFPRGQAGDLAGLLPLITGPDIERVVLGYPEFVDLPLEPDVNYLLIPKRDEIRTKMADLFGSRELEGWYLGTRAAGPTEDGAEAGSGTP